ncbi:hypothetical protein [Lysinibacillus xylanilyticus]|uniref:hypothetical protein n=1 Tax=Lysinibacillus xylanilyticus TaxID=582475 RepID=UPI003D04C354
MTFIVAIVKSENLSRTFHRAMIAVGVHGNSRGKGVKGIVWINLSQIIEKKWTRIRKSNS